MRRRARGTWIAAVLASVGCVSACGDGDDRAAEREHATMLAENAARLTSARSKFAGLDADWRAAIDAVEPATASGLPCDVFDDVEASLATPPSNPEWGGWDIGAFPLPVPKGVSHDLTRTPFPVTFVPVGAPLPAASPESRAAIVHLTAGDHQADDTLSSTDALVQLVAATPGHLRAKVWVYNHQRRELVCSGIVDAVASSDDNRGTTPPSDDLLANLVRAIPKSLHVVAPLAHVPTGDHVFQFGDPKADVRATMAIGQVFERGGVLHVRLASDAKPGCEDQPMSGPRFIFDIPRGPDGVFWTGAPFGVHAYGSTGSSEVSLDATDVTITAHVDQLEPGARVHGTIDTRAFGRGTFEATMCAGVHATELPVLPSAAPAGALRGTLDHAAFAWQSALAIVEPVGDGYAVEHIDLYARGGVTCETRSQHDHDVRLRLVDIGGASTWANLVSTPQPAQALVRLRAGSDDEELGIDQVWVRIDALTAQTDTRLTGKALLWTPASSIGGSFRASVCIRDYGED